MKLGKLFSGSAVLEDGSHGAYPAALVDLLTTHFNLGPGHVGADVGSGSPKLAELFLEHDYAISAVESEADQARFRSGPETRWASMNVITGAPEATGLPDGSVDFILSARALYAPDHEAVRREFRRILRRHGPTLLITDNRVYSGGAQAEAYDEILRTHCKNFRERSKPYDIAAAVAAFFGGAEIYEDAFVGQQTLSVDELLEESSCLPIFPSPEDPQRVAIEGALRKFFKKWAVGGRLNVPKVCRVACGRL